MERDNLKEAVQEALATAKSAPQANKMGDVLVVAYEANGFKVVDSYTAEEAKELLESASYDQSLNYVHVWVR
ncbi:MAG: hypothetical protein UR39_C0004G0030 [Candidatus Woesebacteria bacterium GW2011_GWA1_33_30]|uniref:Uncharacterized protein n=1 Tax=Candidatus Woesebacteria bacterium GW2011_GWA2_33_28 TaxID=1618561 RepID=A0A0G0C8D6_9BACT|nr:MAG: hypothetical protein UR38_C0004G0043 [Candidatus Woesebacteria bacterium GW2011_GWA2_33_28]KKP48409.1 MAG: hypothetical protein UR39_C0004G0030 [Candidatus Woesebacteria bacterium GW2011_GWA1_33_30]KKP49516.1 MAG: hypothetical protein UR40_C0005G0030 [Microgenomates group bacterium GW2011_GWC1_33_32]KKP52481.1 MAG: hypothetical protein UR44_C0002G0030 [Candidatus Woesebacteria bacterium GW2011_GWB1_33_38]KKP58339.1 MAG: hypothetical protein UR48_C0005G0017 [Microgenomates group bacteriu